VSALEGPSAGAATTTNFLGQFSLVGLLLGRYVVRIQSAGFLPTVTWPQHLDQDTTLAQTLVHPDTLAAWSAAGGGPPLNPADGHVLLEVHDAGGALLDSATVEIDLAYGTASVGGAAASVSLPQTASAPALRVNLVPGLYRVFARAPGKGNSTPTDSVVVRAGEVTSTRVDY
jgi:hypothetical protein